MKVTMGKQYETVDGRKVRIYCTDGGEDDNLPVHGAVYIDGGWVAETWTANGKWSGWADVASQYDLREVRPRIRQTMHLNVYEECFNNGAAYSTRISADDHVEDVRLACIAIDLDIPEGYGLDKDEAPVTVKV